ncbi:VOC family protein [Meiothermus hypogaeus]|uniref:Polyphosphate kinase n=2 Tax=Meiothermus hypogaeus TaxID=884155 RepID=A0A511R0P7_9DEIN|nr:VOC family protein [Meiothermus hypogaeus]RIH76959.1 Glyoxalase-like domain protein [Meiothermus hypogaeus]GEM82867.1 polyphosphate kinase [Meiothermus hypogaeus NBRC 106114]
MTRLDHLVLAAKALGEGLQYVQDTLGLELPPAGGKHPLMGTHNRLLNLGNGAYLEIIAIDPEAPPPAQLRWFDLDRFTGAPRLLTWVARTEDLARYQGFGLGPAREARRGELEWHITLPEDGRLHWGGVVPYLIQWGLRHPTHTLPDMGCRLVELVLFHPEAEAVARVLHKLDLELNQIRLEPAPKPELRAFIQTPGGLQLLR